MEKIKIGLAVWILKEDQKETLKNIIKYLTSTIKAEVSFPVYEVKFNEVDEVDYVLCFGSRVKTYIDEKLPSWILVPLEKLTNIPENKEHRKDFFSFLQNIIALINDQQKETKLSVEIQEEVTMGTKDCTFEITEAEVQYLKTLKELLNGSKMTIQKNNIKIEIE